MLKPGGCSTSRRLKGALIKNREEINEFFENTKDKSVPNVNKKGIENTMKNIYLSIEPISKVLAFPC